MKLIVRTFVLLLNRRSNADDKLTEEFANTGEEGIN